MHDAMRSAPRPPAGTRIGGRRVKLRHLRGFASRFVRDTDETDVIFGRTRCELRERPRLRTCRRSDHFL